MLSLVEPHSQELKGTAMAGDHNREQLRIVNLAQLGPKFGIGKFFYLFLDRIAYAS